MTHPLIITDDPTEDPNDLDMLIGQRGHLVFVWCSCELVMHVWDSIDRKELPEVGYDLVGKAMEWTRDEFNKIIDIWMDENE